MAESKLVKHREKKEELLDLFRVSFGYTMSPELWDWKYLQNPLASDDSEVIVAMDGGKVVGAKPFLLAEMWLKDEKVKAAQACDAMVHPQHRRQGIFSRMQQFAIEYFKERGYALLYDFPGPMPPLPGYLKQGWKVVSATENLFQVVNPQRVISYKLKSKLLGGGLGFFYAKLLNTGAREVSPSSSPFQIKVFERFTDELKQVDALRDRLGLDLVRSETYLRWRFDQHPEHNYNYIVTKKDDELWGYAVISIQKQLDGLIYGIIVDYLVRDKNINCFQKLITGCLHQLQESECDLIYTWAFCQPDLRRELIRHFGFKASSKFPYNRFLWQGHFAAREVGGQAMGKLDIYNKDNWRVTPVYSDVT